MLGGGKGLTLTLQNKAEAFKSWRTEVQLLIGCIQDGPELLSQTPEEVIQQLTRKALRREDEKAHDKWLLTEESKEQGAKYVQMTKLPFSISDPLEERVNTNCRLVMMVLRSRLGDEIMRVAAEGATLHPAKLWQRLQEICQVAGHIQFYKIGQDLQDLSGTDPTLLFARLMELAEAQFQARRTAFTKAHEGKSEAWAITPAVEAALRMPEQELIAYALRALNQHHEAFVSQYFVTHGADGAHQLATLKAAFTLWSSTHKQLTTTSGMVRKVTAMTTVCDWCKKEGHDSTNCVARLRLYEQTHRMRCKKCGDVGHLIVDCPSKIQGRRCWSWLDHGSCRRGDQCKFDHSK